MLERFIRKTLPAKIVGVCLIFVIAAFCIMLAGGPSSIANLVLGPKKVDNIDSSLVGQYIEIQVNSVMDSFSYANSKSGHLHDRSYIVPGLDRYYAICVTDYEKIEKIEKMDKLADIFEDYLYHRRESYIADEPVAISGILEKMSGSKLDLYDEFIEDNGGDPDDDTIFSHFVLMEGKCGRDTYKTTCAFMSIAALILIIIGLISLINAIRGKGFKRIKEWLARQPEGFKAANKRLADIYDKDIHIGEMHYDNDLIISSYLGNEWVLDIKDVAWFYQRVTTHRTNGIKTHKTYSVSIRSARDQDVKQVYTLLTDSESESDEIFDKMKELAPNAVVGYSDALYDLYIKSPKEFADKLVNGNSDNQDIITINI